MLCELYSLRCQRVDVGSFDLFLSVTPQLRITQIVSQDIDDVWNLLAFVAA
jgi:hypothetical protein